MKKARLRVLEVGQRPHTGIHGRLAVHRRELVGLLGSKWILLVAPLLRSGPMRNNELMRAVPGISQKMLTQTLRRLEGRQLVVRRNFHQVPPRVEYELTELGQSLAAAIAVFDEWVARNYHLTQPPKKERGI